MGFITNINRLVKSVVRKDPELRLLRSIKTIEEASHEQLLSVDYVADLIRYVGLVYDSRGLYAGEAAFMNAGNNGLWQMPLQLAKCLVYLSPFQINSFLELGTWSGSTVTFMSAYLRRFNPNMRVTTVDIGNAFGFQDRLGRQLDIEFCLGTAATVRERAWDVVFIDADHKYLACRSDYEIVGRQAPICIFHDVNDRMVRNWPANDGGVPRLWNELKSVISGPDEVIDFLDHPRGDAVMGIGMIIRSHARRRGVLSDSTTT